MTRPNPLQPRFEDHPSHLRAIFDAARAAADPRASVARTVRAEPPPRGRFAVLAIGKAAAAMTLGVRDVLGERGDDLVIVPAGAPALGGALIGDHPLPTERNLRHAAAARRFVEAAAGSGDRAGLMVLLSGGASALLCLPIAGVSLDEYRRFTDELLRRGLDIRQLNCLRKHCEQLKGGRLAGLLGPLWCRVYVLSDVVGDPLDTIGSGPFAPDPTTFEDAWAALGEPYPVASDRWPRIVGHLWAGRSGHLADTPKLGDPVFDRVRHVIVANNETAVRGAAGKASALGFRVPEPELLVQGDAAGVGRRFAARAMAMAADTRPACLVLGGETTVQVGSSGGRGGRNQEMALAAAVAIHGVAHVAISTFATDGVDGPTDAAGAIVTGETCGRARALGMDPADFLRRHDSYAFFEKAGGHIKTGPTGTNVNDVAVALVYPG